MLIRKWELIVLPKFREGMHLGSLSRRKIAKKKGPEGPFDTAAGNELERQSRQFYCLLYLH